MIEVWKRHRMEINDAIDRMIGGLFHRIGNFFFDVGHASIFFFDSAKLIKKKPYRIAEVIQHMEFIGNESVLIISLTSVFTGMALSYQIYLGFKLVNATNLVGSTVALGITRELGPVLSGLL